MIRQFNIGDTLTNSEGDTLKIKNITQVNYYGEQFYEVEHNGSVGGFFTYHQIFNFANN